MDYKAIQLVALDLDGTALRSDSTLSENTRQAICALLDRNVEVVVASGRAFSSLPAKVTQIPGPHYAITSNGAAIHRIDDGRRIHGVYLSQAAVNVILEMTADQPVLLETFIAGVAYADYRYVEDPVRWGNSHTAYIHRTRKPVENIRDFLRQNCGNLDSIDIICPDQALKQYFWEKMVCTIPDIYITTSCRQLLEISDRRAGKDAALQILCQKLGISMQQCAAFGNAENDSQMPRAVALGVAVANATPDCLAQADLITAGNDEDGVAQVLWQIIRAKT